MKPTSVSYPNEILYAVCGVIFAASEPATEPSLDPLLHIEPSPNAPPPSGLPSSLPPATWPEPITRKTLASLCLVNKAWNSAARPWLWRKIEVRLPRSWLSLLDEVVGPEGDISTKSTNDESVDSGVAALSSPPSATVGLSDSYFAKLEPGTIDFVRSTFDGLLPSGSVPFDILTPPSSRDSSPNRLRAKSPGRWRLLNQLNDAISVLQGDLYRKSYVIHLAPAEHETYFLDRPCRPRQLSRSAHPTSRF